MSKDRSCRTRSRSVALRLDLRGVASQHTWKTVRRSARMSKGHAVKLTSSSRTVIWVGLLVVVVMGAALFIGLVGSPVSGTLEFELLKYFIQFLLIVALGAVVAFTVEIVKARSERRTRNLQYEIDTVTSLLDRLDANYRAVKRRRRLLRVQDLKQMRKPEYVDAISRLSGDKEEIEKLWRDVEVLEEWMPELGPVRSEIKKMEKYLNALETEWENSGSTRDDAFEAESQVALVGFRKKWDVDGSTFIRFRGPYYAARGRLIVQLADKRADVDRDTIRRAVQTDDGLRGRNLNDVPQVIDFLPAVPRWGNRSVT